MRKLKLFLSLLMVMALSLGNVWAVDYELAYTLTPETSSASGSSAYATAIDISINDVTWNVMGNTTMVPWRIGGKSLSNEPRQLFSKTAIKDNIAKIEIKHEGASSVTVNSMKVEVASDAGFSEIVSTLTPTFVATGTVEVTRPAGKDWSSCYYRITYNVTIGSSNKFIAFSEAKFYKEAEAAAFKITAATNNESYGTVALSGSVITATPKDGYRIASTAYTVTSGTASVVRGTDENINKFTVTPTTDCTVQINFEAIPQYTVTWDVNGATSTSKVNEGAQPVFPETPASCDATSTTFVGWATAPWTGKIANLNDKTVYTKAADMPAVTEAVTYYAVFAKSSGTGAFDGVNGGTFKIYALVNETKYYALGTVASSKINPTEDAAEAADFEIEAVSGGFTIKSGSKYISYTSSTNLAAVDDPYTWSIVAGSHGSWRVNSATDGRAWIYRAGTTNKYGGYSSSNVNGTEYFDLEIAGNASYSDYITTCCTKHNVNIALGIENGTVKADLAEACAGTVVTLTATPNAHCQFVDWMVNSGAITVTDNKFTMPDEDVTVIATFKEIRNAVMVSDPEHGTISVTGADNLASVLEGTELSVSVTGPGYEFTLEAYKVDDESTKVPITDGKLTMPAYGIVITADEHELVSPTILVSKDLIDFGSAVKGGAAPAVETFTISGANLTGNLALAWESDDAYFEWEVTEGSLTAEAGIVAATIRVNVTAKGMSIADTHMDNLIVSGGGATQKEVMVGVEVQQTYTAKWFVNGEELTESTQTAVAGTDLEFPSNPTKLSDDCDDVIFKGWAEAAIEGKQDDAPAYTEKTQMPEADVNFYAVFAVEKENISKEEYQYTIPVSDFNTTSYAANNNEKTVNAVCTTDESKKLEVKYTSNQVMQAGSLIQGQKSAGSIYNAAAWGSKVKSITINDNVEYTYVIGASAQPTETAEGAFFKISAGSATSKASSIDIVFEVSNKSVTYTDYLTTCPSCGKVTLVKEGETNGTFVLKQSGVEVSSVKTCEAAELTVEATPAAGYELSNFAINGIAGAAYNAGMITIPVDAEGTLTATATFSAINYTVTMAQTGGAEATVSADQVNKHIGDEITISANEPKGYAFIGWEATPAVEFANAKALETTFAMPASNVTVTAKYAKILSVTEAIARIDAETTVADQVVEGYVSSLYSSSVTGSGQISYYIKDIDENGFLTGIQFEAYYGKGLNGAAFTDINDVKVGAKVRIFGNLKKHNSTYEFDSNNYQLIYTEAANPAVVVYGNASKTAYYYNENFEFDGLSAKKVYDNGYAEAIAAPSWNAVPAKITENATVAVTASADELTSAVFNVAVTKVLREAEIAWSAAEAKAYTVGKAYTLPTLTNTLGLAVTYTSETPATATISNEAGYEGQVVIVAAGSTVIKATFAGNEEYAAKEVSYTLTVLAPQSVVITGEAKTVYEKGDNFSFDGLGAKAVYAEEDEYQIPAEEIDWKATPGSVEGEYNVAVKATWEGLTSATLNVAVTLIKHTVTIEQPEHATIVVMNDETPVASGDKFPYLTALNITATPDADYMVTAILVNGYKLLENPYLVQDKDITITATVVEKDAAPISWSANAATAVKGKSNTLPTLSNVSELAVAYSSSNADVAAINAETGAIELKAEGKAIITATYTSTAEGAYKTTAVSYELTVEVEKFTITIDPGYTNGTVVVALDAEGTQEIVSGDAFEAGTELYVIATPNANYKVQSIQAISNEVDIFDAENGKFIVGQYDVTVAVAFTDDTSTALDNTEAGENAAKVMLNGQLLIMKNGKTYNAQGQLVK